MHESRNLGPVIAFSARDDLERDPVMVVLCGNPECGAVLRVGARESLVEVTLKPSDAGDFFICPRCGISTLAPGASHSRSRFEVVQRSAAS
jgi:hypothetical protein